MSKKTENPEIGTLQGEHAPIEIPQKQKESSERMKVLSKKISSAIREADNEIDGEFTLNEVIQVLSQNLNAYNAHALKNEWKS